MGKDCEELRKLAKERGFNIENTKELIEIGIFFTLEEILKKQNKK